jgi:hypothetical protein
MSDLLCIHDLIQVRGEQTPEADAIAAPGRVPLTYGRLLVHGAMIVLPLCFPMGPKWQ